MVGQTTWNDQATLTSPYTLTGLTPGSTYEWRVQANCSAESDAMYVNGSNFTPQCNTYYAERTGTITPNSARLIWNAAPPSVFGGWEQHLE